MLGIDLSLAGRRAAGAGGGGQAGGPPVTAIGPDGWRATYPDPPAGFDPEGAPETVAVRRSGHDASAQPVTLTDTLTIMARVRRPYPDQGALTADDVALSDVVYAGDTVAGATNNSTRAYPKPIAMWLNHDRDRATGQSYTARLAVAHAHARSGRPVAAVRFTATDGTTTVEQTVSTMTTASYAASGLTVPHFAGTLDLSTLDADALVTIDAVIYPWVGDAFTISTDADAYPSPNLTVLKVLNDVSYGTAYAYVDSVSGDDGTGTVSETAATAQANPYATIAAAASGIQTYNNANLGRNNASGGVIRLEEGTHTHGDYSAVAVGDIPLLIEAAGAKAATIYQDAGSSTSDGIPDLLKIEGVTLKRNAASSVIFLDNAATLGAANMVVIEDCTFDADGVPPYSAWIYRPGRLWLIGTDGDDCGQADLFSSVAKTVLAIGAAGACARKATYHAAGSKDLGAQWEVQASAANRPAAAGTFIGWCHLGSGSASDKTVLAEHAIGARGLAVVGTVIEQYGSTTPVALALSADSVTNPAQNVVALCNTVVGSRTNLLYQDTGTVEVAKSGTFRFNVDRERNTKTDVFGANGNLVGNWSMVYHAGNRANAALQGGSNTDAYGTGNWIGQIASLGNADGTDASPLDADWADDRSNDGLGGGGGDYTPGASTGLPSIPAGLAPYPHDQAGRSIADDGTAPVGALMPL